MGKHTSTRKRFMGALARSVLRAINWRVDAQLPVESKYVLIGAPHTSNWDLFYTLLMVHSTGLKLHWIGKHTVFWWPLGALLRRLGGIPVNRSSRHDFVSQIIDVFNRSEELVIAITPEGTRSRTKYWKTGFYYMAMGAGVPIAMGYIDFPERVIGIGPSFYPSGDLEADFKQIQNFYSDKRGIHPKSQGAVQLKPS